MAGSLEEGLHTVNVTAHDSVGHSATSTTVTFRVDTTDPEILAFTVPAMAAHGTSFSASWSVLEYGSGYAYAEVYLDDEHLSTVMAPETSLSVEGLSQGKHTFTITVYDWSGRNATAQASISIEPPIEPLVFMLGGLAVLVVVAVVWRKRP